MGSSAFSRRGFLAGGAAVTAGGLLASCVEPAPEEPFDDNRYLSGQTIPFDGPRQAGVETPHQAHLNLVGFRLKGGVGRADLVRLMRSWTSDARHLCQGSTPPGSLEPEMTDKPARLTVTCGFGARAFEVAGVVDKRPSWLTPLPNFSRDQLDPAWGQADVVLQICGDDPITVSHAMRHLIRTAPTYAGTQWVQQGFLSAHGASGESGTPRNLFGQLDGSINPHTAEEFDGQVWDGDATAMVVRRIRMNLDTWEELDRGSRENAIGRRLDDGAPLSGGGEFDAADLSRLNSFGLPLVDRTSHVARAMPADGHPEQRILRRPYNYDLPPDAAAGQLSNSGQVFICFQKDPLTQFVPIQQRLDELDQLNTWIAHIGSGVYWVPPGTRSSEEFWAQQLLTV